MSGVFETVYVEDAPIVDSIDYRRWMDSIVDRLKLQMKRCSFFSEKQRCGVAANFTA